MFSSVIVIVLEVRRKTTERLKPRFAAVSLAATQSDSDAPTARSIKTCTGPGKAARTASARLCRKEVFPSVAPSQSVNPKISQWSPEPDRNDTKAIQSGLLFKLATELEPTPKLYTISPVSGASRAATCRLAEAARVNSPGSRAGQVGGSAQEFQSRLRRGREMNAVIRECGAARSLSASNEAATLSASRSYASLREPDSTALFLGAVATLFC